MSCDHPNEVKYEQDTGAQNPDGSWINIEGCILCEYVYHEQYRLKHLVGLLKIVKADVESSDFDIVMTKLSVQNVLTEARRQLEEIK